MDIYRPRSFLSLVLIGFTLVAFPLILGLVNAATSLNRLTEQSEKAVYQAVQITKNSWLLVEEITAMERNAKQFGVLGDRGLFNAYAETHRQFQVTTGQLMQLPLDRFQSDQLGKLIAQEEAIFRDLGAFPFNSPRSRAAAAAFVDISALAASIVRESNHLIDQEVKSLQAAADATQSRLVWQALALIPGTLIFVSLFTLLISRPIRQIDHAIRRLGDGDFVRPVSVTGPHDLEQLGHRLDWLRRRLTEVDEEKTKFLHHVSHELKTPLAAIREGSDLLNDEVVGDLNVQQAEVARILQDNCTHLQKLIDDLLSFNLLRSRSPSLDLHLVRFDETVKNVVTDHKLFMMKKALDLDLNCVPVWVRGDRQKLRIAVDNLLSNAIKYSPYGGTISMRLYLRGERAVLDVIDGGPGIADVDRPRVFDAFYQGQVAAQGHTKGTGLGLSIAKEYVAAHNGTIEVVDRSTRGAHLRITLDLAQPVMQHAS